MERDLINITKEEIQASAQKAIESIENKEFYGKDKSDDYSDKMVKLHFRDSEAKECRFEHGPFLFIEDVSHMYASAFESRVMYTCACLECGKIKDYQMSRYDRRIMVCAHEEPLSQFYKVRERYIQLKEKGIQKEKIIEELNREEQEKKRSGGKQYIKEKK